MNRITSSPRSSSRSALRCPVPLSLAWSHAGVSWRVTPWPDARFECLYGEEWIPTTPTEDVLASAAQACGASAWSTYLDFVPAPVRTFLAGFRLMRMEALQVVARCPGLLEELADTPALTSFLAAHVSLRGTEGACWAEIGAVFERSGVFGLLEWLGLPASRQTTAILRNLAEPEVPKRLLEPVRGMLWEPRAIFILQRQTAITDQQLAGFCHALAA